MVDNYDRSPNMSSTSLSDNDDDDCKNLDASLVPYYPTDLTPAQWSSTRRRPKIQSNSPASRLPPEILIHVLKQLHSTRDMHSSLLVSRAWCECVVELLWHRPTFPNLSHLIQLLQVICSEEQTFHYSRFIRRLNFISLGRELTDVLFTRLDKCIKLERLTLVNCSEISDDALAHVLPHCPNLVALDLTNITSTTDQSIIALAESATKLQGLNLGGCRNITDEGIVALATHCPLLRRIKLSGVRNITDRAVSALAKSCQLLLEIDLNGCPKITDLSVRDLWTYLTHLRELRLAHCVELTDAAFPAPRTRQVDTTARPFPQSHALPSEELPPLRLARSFEHLRMLDLTACQLVTDDAIEGIISNAPKIRNLVLAKCSLLTNNAVESICKLGKHLHYLHMGHAASITDRSVKTLSRSCTRLRYIDLACCPLLTDMSVFELSGLPKLRRIGLVRVSNLTDNAIFSLADRHLTLERIHLSYCDGITVLAIHFLLQRLTKLTHLSLTGIPAFRRQELQQFCRAPPREFNTSQRAAFCVYSGKGVHELRKYLAELMESVQAEVDPGDNDTDYEAEEEEYIPAGYAVEDSTHDQDGARASYIEDAENVGDIRRSHAEESDESGDNGGLSKSDGVQLSLPDQGPSYPVHVRPGYVPYASHTVNGGSSFLSTSRLETNQSSAFTTPNPSGQLITELTAIPPSSTLQPRTRVFGHDLIIERPSPPLPPPVPQYARSNASDVASNRSTATNASNGAGFFKSYADAAALARTGAHTPDLVFAEIGHGRGREAVAGPGPSTMVQTAWRMDGTSTSPYDTGAGTLWPRPAYAYERTPIQVLADASNSYPRGTSPRQSAVWPLHHATTTPIPYLSSSPTTRELQESVHSALGTTSPSSSRAGTFEGEEYDTQGRGRSVKRSLRNTLNAAEHYASSFFFGRGSSSTHDRNGWPRGRAENERR